MKGKLIISALLKSVKMIINLHHLNILPLNSMSVARSKLEKLRKWLLWHKDLRVRGKLLNKKWKDLSVGWFKNILFCGKRIFLSEHSLLWNIYKVTRFLFYTLWGVFAGVGMIIIVRVTSVSHHWWRWVMMNEEHSCRTFSLICIHLTHVLILDTWSEEWKDEEANANSGNKECVCISLTIFHSVSKE